MIKSNITNKTYLSPIEAFDDYCNKQQCDICPFAETQAHPCISYLYENPEEATSLMNCEKVEPCFKNLETGCVYYSLLDVFNTYCNQYPDCEGCYFHTIEDDTIADEYDCYYYFSNHVDDCLSYLGYARTPLNGQNTEINNQKAETPAICTLLGVRPNEIFFIADNQDLFRSSPFDDAPPAKYYIDKRGNPWQSYINSGVEEKEEMSGMILAGVLNGIYTLVHTYTCETDQDIADARALRRIFPSAKYVIRINSLNLYLVCQTEDSTQNKWININPEMFISLKPNESFYLEDNAGF